MIPKTITELRAKTGLDAAEFGHAIFCSPETIAQIECEAVEVSWHAWELAKLVFDHPDANALLKLQAYI